jgi:hypothetical protein
VKLKTACELSAAVVGSEPETDIELGAQSEEGAFGWHSLLSLSLQRAAAASFGAHLLHSERFCKEYLINTPHSAFSLFQIYGCKLLYWKHIKDGARGCF